MRYVRQAATEKGLKDAAMFQLGIKAMPPVIDGLTPQMMMQCA